MDAQAKAALDRLATLAPESATHADDATWLAAFRHRTALIHELSAPAEPVHAIEHHLTGDLPVRLYRPIAGDLPAILWLHGGGAIAGSVDGHEPLLRQIALRTGWTVAAPLYRLAPEHRFPAQLDDAMAALEWLATRSDRIVVAGDSIGGTLATALATRARNCGIALAGQALFYPNTDLRRDADYPSRRTNDGKVIDLASLERQIDLYLTDHDWRTSPEASPILADPAGLPPTLIVTCGEDPLADEGIAYAQRLVAAGVEVRHEHLLDLPHAFLQLGRCVDRGTAILAGWPTGLDPAPASP